MSRIQQHPFAVPLKPKVHTLKEYCVFTLIQHRQCLEDVGFMETEALKDVLRHCDAAELTVIEDATREGSERDLTWYTWHLWYSLYTKAYGRPPPNMEVPELEGEPPIDYVAPACEVQPGDWRAAYQNKVAQDEAKLRNFSAKIGARYKEEQRAKDDRTVKAVVIAAPPPLKRRKTVGPPARTNVKPTAALFSKHKPQLVVRQGQGWGKGPIQSMVKKKEAPGLASGGVKIVATAAARAKRAAAEAAANKPSPAAALAAAATAAAVGGPSPGSDCSPAAPARHSYSHSQSAPEPHSSMPLHPGSHSRSSPSPAAQSRGPLHPGAHSRPSPTQPTQSRTSLHPGAHSKPATNGPSGKPASTASFLRTIPPASNKPKAPARPSSSQAGAAKRQVSSLSGVDLAELVAAAGAKKLRQP